ncbi:hypothetical protein D3C87_280400 [compost metagenome]
MSTAIPNINVPKRSSSTLEPKNNFYVVRSGLLFNYFPIKVLEAPPEAPIFRFEKTPPVIVEGVAIISGKIYLVTPEDLLRGVVRKSREITIAKREDVNGNAGTSGDITIEGDPSTGTGGIASGEAVRHQEQQGAGSKARLEVCQAADSTWANEVGALLDFIDSKEEEFGFQL